MKRVIKASTSLRFETVPEALGYISTIATKIADNAETGHDALNRAINNKEVTHEELEPGLGDAEAIYEDLLKIYTRLNNLMITRKK